MHKLPLADCVEPLVKLLQELAAERGKTTLNQIEALLRGEVAFQEPERFSKLQSVPVLTDALFSLQDSLQKVFVEHAHLPIFLELFTGPAMESITGKAMVDIWQLGTEFLDGPVRDKLGKNHELRLAQFFKLLRINCDTHFLSLTHPNVAYILDHKKNPWAIEATWLAYPRTWFVRASPITARNPWPRDSFVIGLNTSQTEAELPKSA